MATVLYITAHPLDAARSFSLAAAEAFLESYREARPGDEIVPLDLYREDIPLIDADVLGAWGRLQSGAGFDQLTVEQQRKVGRLNQLTDQFIAANRYLFVTPLWNLGLPPMAKAYIDSVCIAGKTFRYTETGPIGLLTDKMALHIHARGGFYSEGPTAGLDFGEQYLSAILRFLGVPSYESLIIEGHAAFPDRAEQLKGEAIERARELAKRWATATPASK